MEDVHIIGEHKLKRTKGEPITLGQYEAYMQAMYNLFPTENNKAALEQLQDLKNNKNATILFKQHQ